MFGSIRSFEPIIDENSKVLILGTLPGPESIRRRQYYANPNNQFWEIIYNVFREVNVGSTYKEKVCFVLKNKLAVWDVFHSTDRKGALDADIKNEEPNAVRELVQAYPNLKRILLNGRKAEKSFYKYFPDITIKAVYVPSTSPAYAGKPINEKIKDWEGAIINY